MGRHALLSASSSHRWLACPPSARLCENYEDTGSEYAQQGTDAHSLCEHKLKLSLGMETKDPTEGLAFYDEEMEECACGYAEYVLSLVEEAKRTCKDPVVLIEQRLDFSRYVEEGFGIGDCVIIADGTLYIIDYKHGKDTVFATAALEQEKAGLQEEMNVVAGLIQQCINENARVALDQAEYQAKYNALADRFQKAKERLEAVSMEITESRPGGKWRNSALRRLQNRKA